MTHEDRLTAIDRVIAQGPFDETWKSLKNYRVPDWYSNGKFGIFIHWGPYCVPAFGNEWYPRQMYTQGTKEFEHHRATYGPQNVFGYKDFIPMFKAEQFNAEEWAQLFAESGARFVVPVAEHHDGFAMYQTAHNRWNAAEMGPCRDVVAELGKAVRGKGMVLGASTHRAEHWFFMGGGREFPSDVQDEAYRDFYGPAMPRPQPIEEEMLKGPPSQAWLEDWLIRTCELIDLHRPQILWFDWWISHERFKPYLRKLAAYYYNRAAQWGIGVAINYKHDAFEEGTAVFDVERGQLREIRPMLWQNDTSVSKNSWGYIEGHDYKQPQDIVADLADVVSKNGALLLNIGPKADGTIPEPEKQMLRDIGAWLRRNGEAIYGTRPWKIYGEGPTDIPEGSFTDTKRQAFTAQDIRFTQRDGAVYAIVLAWPDDGKVSIRSLGSRACLIDGVKGVKPVDGIGNAEWTRGTDSLDVTLECSQDGYPVVLRIDLV